MASAKKLRDELNAKKTISDEEAHKYLKKILKKDRKLRRNLRRALHMDGTVVRVYKVPSKKGLKKEAGMDKAEYVFEKIAGSMGYKRMERALKAYTKGNTSNLKEIKKKNLYKILSGRARRGDTSAQIELKYLHKR